MHNSWCWGLRLPNLAPNLDVAFSGLDLDVRNTIDDIRKLDESIIHLERELEIGIQQRDKALRALASVNAEPREDSSINIQLEPLVQEAAPSDALPPAGTPASVSSPLEQLVPAGVHPPVGPKEGQHNQNVEDQPQALHDMVDRVLDEPSRPSELAKQCDAAASHVPLLPTHAQPVDTLTVKTRQPESAEDIKNRLLQVLRHLRDTATCCRDVKDLDRGFSRLLKSTYKTLYDSLKGGRPAAAVGANAAAAAATGSSKKAMTGTRPAAPPPLAASQRGAADATGAGAEPAAGPVSSAAGGRDLSALARLVLAKRVHHQADGGPTRDADQPPARRPARSSTPATSAGTRVPTLYDGLPPVRVLTAAPSHIAQVGSPTAAAAKAVQPTGVTDAAQALGLGSEAQSREATPDMVGAGTELASTSASQGMSPTERTLARGMTPQRQCTGAGTAADSAHGACQAEASQSFGVSPSRQLLEQARASGGGLAHRLLMQASQPLAVSGTLSMGPVSEGSQPPHGAVLRGAGAVSQLPSAHAPQTGKRVSGASDRAAAGVEGHGGRNAAGGQQPGHGPVMRKAAGAEEGCELPTWQQRAKRALVLEPVALGLPLGALSEVAPASAKKRQHTSTGA